MKKGKEWFIKELLGHEIGDYGNYYNSGYEDGLAYALKLAHQLDEPEKEVMPKFAEELIEALYEELNEYHPEFDYDAMSGFESAIATVKDLLEPRINGDNRMGTGNNTCRWVFSDDFDCVIWSSECGLDWQFSNPETPADNEMIYCPKCGQKLEVAE